MSWDGLRTYFYTEWASVEGPRLYAVLAFVAAIAAVWMVLSWTNSATIASMRKRLGQAEERDREFAGHFHGRSIAEVAARLRKLEGYAVELPARRLTEEQKLKLASIGAPPPTASYLAVVYDARIEEVRRYAHDLIDVLTAAPGWNVVDSNHPRMERLASPVTVALEDPDSPTATEALVLKALREADIDHGLARRPAPGLHAQIIISER